MNRYIEGGENNSDGNPNTRTFVLPQERRLYHENIRVLLFHFQNYDLQSVSMDAEENVLGIHMEKAEEQHPGSRDCVLVVDRDVYRSFDYLSRVLVPRHLPIPDRGHVRLASNTQAVSEIESYAV